MRNRLPVFSWCLYDFANSAFVTLIGTFIFATYFTTQIVSDGDIGTQYWSLAATVTAIVVALTSPFLGAIADRGGYRKKYLIASTVTNIVFTALLYTILPGEVLPALIFYTIANISMEISSVFYNAFLPEIAPPDKIGRISGYGWGCGYIGGLLAMALAMVALINPETPWFGVGKENFENVRMSAILTAAWFAVFSLPLFLFIREKRSTPTAPAGRLFADSWAQLKGTFREARKYKQMMIFLGSRLLFNDALVTVYAFGGIYAAGTFGFELKEIMLFGIVLNVTAGIGSFALGFLDDILGGKRTIQISLIGLIVASFIAVFSPHKIGLWIAGILVGIFGGPNQSASRSLMGRFTPADKENEFFGLFAFSGKATSFLSPFLLGLLTRLSGSQRVGISIVIVFFILGYIVLQYVDEKEGMRAARTNGAPEEGAPVA